MKLCYVSLCQQMRSLGPLSGTYPNGKCACFILIYYHICILLTRSRWCILFCPQLVKTAESLWLAQGHWASGLWWDLNSSLSGILHLCGQILPGWTLGCGPVNGGGLAAMAEEISYHYVDCSQCWTAFLFKIMHLPWDINTEFATVLELAILSFGSTIPLAKLAFLCFSPSGNLQLTACLLFSGHLQSPALNIKHSSC